MHFLSDFLTVFESAGWPGLSLSEGPDEWACHASSGSDHALLTLPPRRVQAGSITILEETHLPR